MAELEALRALGADAESADASTRASARAALLAAAATERSSGPAAAPRPAARRRRMGVRGAVAVGVALLLPSGYAVGELTGTIGGADPVPASACREATAAFQAAGLNPPTDYANDCPTPERVEAVIRARTQAERGP